MSNEETLNEKDTELNDTPEVAETDQNDGAQTPDESVGVVGAPVDADMPVEQPTESKKSKVAKPEKSKPEKTGGMNKLFKRIYYPVIALFAVLMLVFSAIDGAYGYKPSAYDGDYYDSVNAHIVKLCETSRSSMTADGISAARDYITGELEKGGFTLVDEDKPDDDNNDDPIVTRTDWARNGNLPVPTVTVQTSVLSAEAQTRLGYDAYLVGTELTNIIAAIPSKATADGNTSDAIIITARYDARPDTEGAVENSSFVANLMQTLSVYAKAKTEFANDIIVVFTEDLDNSFGANAFFESFTGLGDAVSRAKAGLSLDSFGNAGTLAVVDASNAGLDYFNAYAKTSGNALNLSVVPDSVADEYKNKGAIAVFGEVPAIQVAVLGGTDAAQSQLDTAANLSQSVVYQQAAFLKDYLDSIGNSTDVFAAPDASGELVYFTYLDGGTVAYTATASYVIGAVIIALAIAAVAVLAVKKAFSVKKLFKAAVANLLTVICTLIASFAAYFLVTLMLCGFGVLPIHSIISVRHFNAGILIAAMLVSLAGAFGFSTVFKKLFKVTSSDAVRGTAMLFALVGAVMSFACPAYSFVTSWLGMLLAAVLLVSACFKNKFNKRFGFGMDRLFLYVIPVTFCLPLVMPTIVALTGLMPLVLLPVIMTLFTATLGVVAPYLDRTKVLFDKVAKKLPKRTIRVQRVVTERVEDRAKKGKFTEQTVKRIEKEKVAVNYKNYFGIAAVSVIAVIVALFSGGFGADYAKSVTSPYAYTDFIYNDSMVYELTYSGDTPTQRIVVSDLMAYKFIRNSVDLEWDSEKGYYYKSVNYNTSEIIDKTPSITRSGKTYSVSTYEGNRSIVTLTIPSARSVTKITLKADGSLDEYEYSFNGVETITLRLPYGFADSFTLEVDGGTPNKIEYTEYNPATAWSTDNAIDQIDEWNTALLDNREAYLGNNLRGGIVLKRTFGSL